MKYKITRHTREAVTWIINSNASGACPVCHRYWVSLRKDYKLFHVEEQPSMGPRALWQYGWRAKSDYVCSSKCVDMWLLQHI